MKLSLLLPCERLQVLSDHEYAVSATGKSRVSTSLVEFPSPGRRCSVRFLYIRLRLCYKLSTVPVSFACVADKAPTARAQLVVFPLENAHSLSNFMPMWSLRHIFPITQPLYGSRVHWKLGMECLHNRLILRCFLDIVIPMNMLTLLVQVLVPPMPMLEVSLIW